MASADRSAVAPVTLENLIALNDEIAALARAGVPLEEGLMALGGDMPGQLGRLSERIAKRMAAGEPLEVIFNDPAMGLPPVYRAVVAAGLRSGRLSSALESMAGALRRLAQTRQDIVAAAFYPLMVLMTACGMLAVFCTCVAPPLAAGVAAMGLPFHGFFSFLAAMGRWAPYWGVAIPLVLVLVVSHAWRGALRGTLGKTGRWQLVFEWIPWVGQMARTLRLVAFTEILTSLIENRIALGEACVLAAEASADHRLAEMSLRLAASLYQGQSAADFVAKEWDIPPRLRWVLATASHQANLAVPLRNAAENYRRQASHLAGIVRIVLPIVLLVIVGGGATLTYALMLFLPYTQILRALM